MISAVDAAGLQPAVAWMADRIETVDDGAPTSWELLEGGRSNLTYRVSQGPRSWVVRRPPLGHVMETAHDMAREYRVLSALGEAGYPAPPALALCEDPAVIGAPFLVMGWVPGRQLATRDDTTGLALAEATNVSAACARALGALHTLSIGSGPLSRLGRPTGFLGRQTSRWLRQWPSTKTRERPVVDELGRWLSEHVERLTPDQPESMVHGDYRLDNLILRPEDLGVAAVLDWEMATLGQPAADLAVALVYWNQPGDNLRRRVPVAVDVTAAPGFLTRRGFVDQYVAATGREPVDLDFALALACFKLAVIMESINYRFIAGLQRGTAGNAGAQSWDEAPDALAELGLACVRHGLDGLSA